MEAYNLRHGRHLTLKLNNTHRVTLAEPFKVGQVSGCLHVDRQRRHREVAVLQLQGKQVPDLPVQPHQNGGVFQGEKEKNTYFDTNVHLHRVEKEHACDTVVIWCSSHVGHSLRVRAWCSWHRLYRSLQYTFCTSFGWRSPA